MPPKKRKGRSSAAPSSRRNNRRSKSPQGKTSSRERRTSTSLNSSANHLSNNSEKSSIKGMGKLSSSKYQSVEEEEAATKRAQEISESYTMHTITHHTSFIPTTALQYSSLASRCRIPGSDSGLGKGVGAGVGAITGTGTAMTMGATTSGGGSSSLTSSIVTKSTSSSSHGVNSASMSTSQSQMKTKPYALYHPRNLGLLPPTIVKPSNDHEFSTTSVSSKGGIHLHSENMSIERTDLNTPHSAGCRMKFLTQPTFHHLPPSSSNPHNLNSTVPTVMVSGSSTHGGSGSTSNGNKYPCEGIGMDVDMGMGTADQNKTSTSNCGSGISGQIAIGDSGGYVTLYTTIPTFRPLITLSSSASDRFEASRRPLKRKRSSTSQNGNSQGSSSSTSATISSSSSHPPLHKPVPGVVAGSSIDKSNAVECMTLLRDGVCIGTRMEIEYITFEPTQQRKWIWDGDYGWDELEKKKMIRGIPLRLDNNDGNFCSFSSRIKEDGTIVKGGRRKILASFGFIPGARSKSNENDDTEMRPDLYSPLLMIDADTGDLENVIPLEKMITQDSANASTFVEGRCNGLPHQYHEQKGKEVEQWAQCSIGPRATAMFDKRNRQFAGYIIATFITYSSENVDETTMATNGEDNHEVATQELMVLNSNYHIIHRTTLPTKSTGPKLITVEMINQSPHGDFTIAATSKGGIRVYKTNGLILLGAYGEGVSLHGHSIVWQDVFFVRMDRENAITQDDVSVFPQNGNESKDAIKCANGKKNNDSANVDDFIISRGSAVSSISDLGPKQEQEQWGALLERVDELEHRQTYVARRKAMRDACDSLCDMFVVSVPSAFREPVDMKETIHFWDLAELEPYIGLEQGFPHDGLVKLPGTTLPAFTIQTPKKSDGVCTFLYDDSMMTSHAGRFLLSTHSGECLQITPSLTTDWAGQMYPAGFLVLDNNLAYIEDEDELDEVIDSHVDTVTYCQVLESPPKQNEAELELALRMSMMDAHIDVVGDDDDGWRDSVIDVAPCYPEPHLKHLVQNKSESDNDEKTNNGGVMNPTSVFDLLKNLPQHEALGEYHKKLDEKLVRRNATIAETKQKIIDENGEPVKIPRRKATNIDYIINAAVDKHLTINMLEKRTPSSATGLVYSADIPLREQNGSTSLKNVFCAACFGRSIIHACGKRARPIDYDAIAQAAKEKKEREEAEKKKLQQERRKAAEQRRKEKKKRLKEEERKAEEERLRAQREEEEMKLEQSPNKPTQDYEDSMTVQSPMKGLDGSPSHFSAVSQSPNHSSVYHHTMPQSSTYQSLSSSYHNEIALNHSSSPQQHQYSPHYGDNLNFGDSMLSNIPALPSEPSSFMYSNQSGHDSMIQGDPDINDTSHHLNRNHM